MKKQSQKERVLMVSPSESLSEIPANELTLNDDGVAKPEALTSAGLRPKSPMKPLPWFSDMCAFHIKQNRCHAP
jgi:hypothetical protein